MATFTKFNCFTEDLAEKVHNLGSDTLKVALTNSAPVATNTVLANITEVSYTNLSGANPRNITVTSSAQTSGTYKLVVSDLTLTASGGTVGPFRYVVIYNDTSTSDSLIAYYDYGSSFTIQDGDQFLIDFDATNGLLTIA